MAKLERYENLDYELPAKTLRWQLSRGTLPDLELVEVDRPVPGPDQIGFRVDTNAICFSDVKVLTKTTSHPRMIGYDLAKQKLVPGHEISITITEVGENAAAKFKLGERYMVQADMARYKSAVGYNLWGGMRQFGVFDPVDQEYLIRIEGNLGFSEASLVEPYACVEASCRRADLAPTDQAALLLGGGGPMGQMHLERCLGLARSGRCPALKLVMVTDISPERLEMVRKRFVERAAAVGVKVAPVNVAETPLPRAVKAEGIDGFDYIVALAPIEKVVAEAVGFLKGYGVLNAFAGFPRGSGAFNLGDLHYDQHTVTGNSGSEIADMKAVMQKVIDGSLETNNSAGAVAGFRANKEGLQQVAAGTSPNKIVVYNQLPDLPLTAIEDMPKLVDFSEKVRAGVEQGFWSKAAEREMLEQMLVL